MLCTFCNCSGFVKELQGALVIDNVCKEWGTGAFGMLKVKGLSVFKNLPVLL